MSCSRTCLKGAVVVGLIAALTPGLWAQPLQQQPVTPPGGTDALGSLSEVQPTATPLRAILGDKVLPGIRTDAPPALPAQGGLIWFNNQAEFEAFNAGEGKVLKGTEDYEESILDPNGVDGFDDPLESGVPNLPDGFPFPNGMTGLPNLIVQSNLGGGDPTDENPRGVGGLAAASAGFAGAVSDVVIANTFVDSLDLIFTDEKSGVGFNTLTLVRGDSVEVRVYSTSNVFLGMMTAPADPSGTNFIGVFAPVPILRVNIFDPGGGAEGGDNIQAWEAGPQGGLIWFDNQDAFEAFNAGKGKDLKGIEDYEEANLNPDEGVGVDDPLVSGIPNPPVFPDGLTGLPNLQVQSNLGGGNPDELDPRGTNGLAAWAAPGGNFVSDVVIANFFVDSLDLIFLTNEKTGVGGNTLRFTDPGSIEMRVYDINNNFLGMMTAPADPRGTNFLGVWSPIPIGRVNLWSPDGGAEGLDNIQAWQEVDPCPWDISGDGIVGASDLLSLLVDWGACGDCNDCPADFDDNCVVGASDLLKMLVNWGDCPGGNPAQCDKPGTCDNGFPNCGGDPDCFCFTLFDGSGICVQSLPCEGLELCPDGDCPPGQLCTVLTCCGENVCVPEEALCGNGVVSPPPPGTKTISGEAGRN